jgi:hypothetical protein
MIRKITWLDAIGAVVVVTITAVFCWCWFAPSGGGEYRTSPNGRFTAYASNLSRSMPVAAGEAYIELRVEDDSTGKEIWRVTKRPTAGAKTPDYRNGGNNLIVWAEDSSSVTIPVGNGQAMTLPVP